MEGCGKRPAGTEIRDSYLLYKVSIIKPLLSMYLLKAEIDNLLVLLFVTRNPIKIEKGLLQKNKPCLWLIVIYFFIERRIIKVNH